MPQRRSRIAPSAAQSELATALAALKDRLDAPREFSATALAEAESASAPTPKIDLRELPFATLDPAQSRDLDQAFHLERSGDGFTVRYAIADVPSFITPGGALDQAARERGQTLYAPDGSVPLHPLALSEGSASLLPEEDRPALVWTFTLDSEGAMTAFTLERALIRSVAKLDYITTQAALDAGEDSPAALLPEVGKLRAIQEGLRGGASLNLPDEEVVRHDDGTYSIERRHALPTEDWNAQLSLMTGMAAAELMLRAKVGILRTMPAPDEAAFAAFRRRTEALGAPWTEGNYGEYLRSLDRNAPETQAILLAAASLFRGAGYVAFDGEIPEQTEQSAIAAPYAHATAPLRRLVDRWVLAICLAVSEEREISSWVRESLHSIPDLMQSSGQRASQLNSATMNCVEAALLQPLVGSAVTAVVIDVREDRARIQIAEPAVAGSVKVSGDTAPGTTLSVRVESANIAQGTFEFSVIGASDTTSQQG